MIAIAINCIANASHAQAPKRSITVFAASSLQESFRALAAQFEAKRGVEVKLSFAGSQELRAQLEEGAQADLFASADLRHAEALAKEGLAEAPRPFARNALVIAVAKGNPAHVAALADLARLDRVVLGAHEVPVGLYSERLLDAAEKETPGLRERVLAQVVSREPNVRQVLAKVALGEAQAALVYRTDARALAKDVDAVELPEKLSLESQTEDEIELLKKAAHPDDARAFLELLFSPEGQAALAAQGFRPVSVP